MMVFSNEYTMPSRAARLTAVCACGAAHGDHPRLVQEEFGAAHGGIEGQPVIGRERLAQRDAQRAIDCR